MLVDLDSYSHDSAGYTLRLDGALIATGQPPWQVSVSHLAPGAHTLTLRSETFPDLADEATVYVVRAALVPDYDRDGVIGALDKARAATNTLFRWWINDDDDNGSDVSEGEDDVPGQGYGMTTVSNDTQWPDSDEVDGRCDLLDFFPLWLDIEGLPSAAQTDGNWTLRLSQADSAVQVVYIDLSAASAGSYLVSDVTGCGQDFTQSAHEAQTLRVGADGMGLVPAFLSRIVANPQKCVLLVEGRAATQSPLVLEVFRNGTRIARGEMPLRISGVEDMYRWVNLRGVAGGGESRPTDLTVPSGFPDACSSGKHFIFVHGYNVSEEKARAWNAEMFKRLWQAGSKAMYTAVTWHGNDSQAWWWLNKTPNYYANVANAFATASNLAATVNGSLPGAVKVIAGHSLGNMVISSAIVDHGLNADTYFMLNAAVAQEAYDAAVDHADTMRHPDWQGYARRLWASDWCNLFTNDTADARGTLTWRDRFGDIPGAINYYSSTEDVLANSDGTLHTFLASDWSWVNQEMRKGLWPFLVPGNNEAGWAFNRSHDVTVGYDPHTGAPVKELMPPATANLLPGSVLQTNSFFSLFDNRALYGTNGSAVAAQPAVRAQLLADAIPALSDPMGCNPLDWGTGRNRNMHEMRNGWPEERMNNPNDPKNNRWLHSDIKNVAFPFVHKVFERICTDGGLKQ